MTWAEGDTTSNRIDEVIEQVERVQKALCAYGGGTLCDCKYGFPSDVRAGTEQTGCPELRNALGFLRNMKRAMTGEWLFTAAEWSAMRETMDRNFPGHVGPTEDVNTNA